MLQGEGLLRSACDNTWACNNTLAAFALGILVDSCGGSADMGRNMSDETLLSKEVGYENFRCQAAEASVAYFVALA